MPETKEQAPGVYVRTGDYQPHELDMLWSGSRTFSKEDRSPIVFTVVGLVVGTIITSALFFLFTSKPEIKTGENELMAPIVNETELVPKVEDPTVAQPVAEQAPEAPTVVTTPKATNTNSTATSGTSYVVQNGDTLEKIARRFYGSGAPVYINKISRANRMANPHRLQIGQRLVIPPKNY